MAELVCNPDVLASVGGIVSTVGGYLALSGPGAILLIGEKERKKEKKEKERKKERQEGREGGREE